MKFHTAFICTKGHIISSTGAKQDKHCTVCGNPAINQCTHCNEPIRGSRDYSGTGIIAPTSAINLPYYCHQCGNPYPWTESLINNAAELLSLDENLDQETINIIKNAIPDLLVECPSTPLAVAKYNKYISKAAKFAKDGMYQLLISVISDSVKKSLFG